MNQQLVIVVLILVQENTFLVKHKKKEKGAAVHRAIIFHPISHLNDSAWRAGGPLYWPPYQAPFLFPPASLCSLQLYCNHIYMRVLWTFVSSSIFRCVLASLYERVSVRPSVGRYVCDAFVKVLEKAFSAQFYHCLSMHKAFLCLFDAIRAHRWPLGLV